jgi:hypothetical protein
MGREGGFRSLDQDTWRDRGGRTSTVVRFVLTRVK